MHSRSDQISILFVAALLSISAGFIHLLVTPEHFREWWGYGAFFAATVITQSLYAPTVIYWPRRTVFAAGIIGNVAIAAMWVVSRSMGVPFFGPGAGEVEPVGTLDVISTALEIALVVILAATAWTTVRQSRPNGSPRDARLALEGSTNGF